MSETFQKELENGAKCTELQIFLASRDEKIANLEGIIRELVESAAENESSEVLESAERLCGKSYVIKCKIAKGAYLVNSDLEYIDELLGECNIETH